MERISWKNSKCGGDVALTSVPYVVTCRPGKGTLEGVDQVENGPGQHHDVVDVQVGHDHLRCHSDPCRKQEVVPHSISGLSHLLIEKIFLMQFTLEHGADLHPGSHPTLTGVLAQSRLQEEQGNTTEEEENKIRDEEDTCNHQKTIKSHALEVYTLGQRSSSLQGREIPLD